MHWVLIIIFVISQGISAWAKPSSGVGLQVIDKGQSGFTVKFDLAEISTNTSKLENTSMSMTLSNDGKEIPIFSQLIEIPPGHRAVVKNLERKSRQLLPQAFSLSNESTPISAQEISALSLDPPVAVICSRSEVWRGRTVSALKIYPVQINTENNSVIENQTLEFDIIFEPDHDAGSFIPVRDIPGNEMARMIDNILLNTAAHEFVEVPQAHRGRMLILVQDYSDDDRFLQRGAPWIDSLATWKRNMGFRVEVVQINFGELSSQQIKNEVILPRYDDQNDPLTYVLLIGGGNPGGEIYFPTYRPPEGEIGDHFYSTLEGNSEYLADIAIGRLEAEDFNQLKGIVKRTINYERDPYVEPDDNDENGGEWLDRALFTAENIVAPGGQFVPSMMHLGRWVVNKLENYGYDSVDTLWADSRDANIRPEVQEALEMGTGVAISRGWLSGCFDVEGNYDPPENFRKYPFVIAVTCLSYETQLGYYQFVDHRTGNHGPIAAIAMAGLSNTTPNNSLLGGSLRGLAQFDLYQTGLIQMFGKFQMWSDKRYELGATVLNNVAVFRLMGDPTTQIFTANPITMEAEFPESISIAATGLSVQVTSDGEAIPDAWVSIYQTDGIKFVCQPGLDGWARFTFLSDMLESGEIGVTITRYNALPVHGSIEVIFDGERIDLTEVQFYEDDGVFANGEVINTTLTFTNNGDNDLGEVSVVLSTDDPFVNIVDDQILIEDMPAGEERQIEFDIGIDRSSQAGRIVRIQAVASVGDTNWESAFSFETSGHKLSIVGSIFPNNDFEAGDTLFSRPVILNSGDLPTPVFDAVLISLSPYVSIIRSEATYSEIDGDDSGPPRSLFRVEAEVLAVNGSIARFKMILSATDENDSFRDTLYFEEVIGNVDINDPYGPDDYGYLIFDSGDTDWAKAPEYDWKEINPYKNDGDVAGRKLILEDYRVDLDSTIAIQLPFPFQFYGETFETIAINSNGWIAFGADKTQYLDFRNQQLPGIQGPDAQIAVFWQDLINYLENEHAGVYYHWDEELGIFIIEWSDMRIYQDTGESVQVQIILFDSEVYPTTTGDGEIKLQYKTAPRVEGDRTDNKFCSVGIKNLDGTGGLEYTYWNQYPAANRPLEDEFALFITADRFPSFGSIEGVITREEDQDAGIEGVSIRTLRSGEETVTDNEGNFYFESVLTGREQLRFTKQGFNALVVAVDVEDGEVSLVEAGMTHPRIIASEDPIDRGLHTGDFGVTFHYNIENPGNGPLLYDFSRRYSDGSSTEYAQTWTANLSEMVENDNNLVGCQFVGDEIYVTGGRNPDDGEGARIYVFSRDENGDPVLVRSFLQPNQTRNGFFDLAWNGNKLFGGENQVEQINDTTWINVPVIVEFDLNGNNVRPIVLDVEGGDLAAPYALAYNPRDGTLITSWRDKDIFVFDLDGNLVNQVDLFVPGARLDVYGFAWNDNDDDDMPLYIIDLPAGNVGIRLTKANPETGETRVIGILDGFFRDRPTGCTIGYEWDSSTLNLATIAGGVLGGDNDLIRVYEIGPDSHYLKIQPAHGRIASGQSVNIMMEMRSNELGEGEYSHTLVLSHDADDEEIIMLATLDVNDSYRVDGNDNQMPDLFSLEQSFPNPFNNTTRIDFTLTVEAATQLTIYDITGRQVVELINEKLQAGRHSVLFNPQINASGIYLYQLKSGDMSVVKRMVFLK